MNSFKVFSISLILILFFSCKKYEEGPSVSLKSKTERIARKWTLNEVYNNNELVINELGDKNSLDLSKDGTGIARYWCDCDTLSYDTTFGLIWNLSVDKEYLHLTYSNIYLNADEPSKIIKLTSKELWLDVSSGNNEIELRYTSN